MNKRTKRMSIGTVAPLALFAVITVCIVAVLLTGANTYKSFTDRDSASYDHRTVSRYLTARMRQSDAEGAYFVGDFTSTAPQSEGDTFFFCETFGDETYHTRIYCHDGYLCELFALAGEPFEPEDGEKIIKAQSLHFTVNEGTVTVDIRYGDGTLESLVLCPSSHGEVAE